jgi:outer membrane protein OmpA-like peptidoglycan-associated protein
MLNHQAEIVNRISVEVTDVTEDGSGIHQANFMTSENSVGRNKVSTWGQEYNSIFTRSKNGTYDIADEFFMPVVRDVPVFPDRDLKPGDSWQCEGHEAHDLRQTFNIATPYQVPFTAYYTYQGETEKDGQKLHVIKATYNLYFTSPTMDSFTTNSQNGYFDYPISTMGYSDQTIYFDNERGTIQSYTEKFRIQLETVYGNTFIFQGTAGAEVSDIQRVNTVATIEKVQKELEDLGIQNTEVVSDEKGITISIENIQFKADSAILQNSEKEKLKKIAQILSAFPDNDLLISGHTALAGNAESRQKLSEERANSVAEFLIELGVKDAHHIFTQGFGATKPIAPNTNTAGMARNRRVEITIMEK